MKWRTVLTALLMFGCAVASRANVVVTPWMPIFKGVQRAIGTNFPGGANLTLQVVNCVRVDLTDPDVQLLPTPRSTNYAPELNRETLTLSVSNFLKVHNLQVAINANFYWSYCCGSSDPSAEWRDAVVFGLMISTGVVVSVPDAPPPNDANMRGASLLFTTNKEPSFAFNNYPPGVGTTGIYSAVTGYYPVVTNGVNIGDLASSNYPDPSFHFLQPRTGIGVSADKRYLFLMTIDGRQSGYSDGATDRDVGDWFLQFGASDGILMDGGGSTSMYMADCVGNPIALNHSSYIAGRGRERYVGGHLGIYAKALDSLFSDIAAEGGNTTAVITWTTHSNATSQVEYGLTPSYGNLSPLDLTPVTNHTVMLSGLAPGSRYYYRVRSQSAGVEYVSSCGTSTFSTTNVGVSLRFGLTNTWKYDTANFDGVNWQSPAFDDSGWASGPGVLLVDTRGNSPNAASIPNYFNGTRMSADPSTTYPYRTYYFRTRFAFSNSPNGVTLTFSNYVDDGAVYYLNGTEIYRANMPAPPTVILNSTTASSTPCGTGDATCPQVFSISGLLVATNLVTGTNVIAVEVHNFSPTSPDVTFESALFMQVPPVPLPFITNIVVVPGETNATISWVTGSNSTSQVLYGLTPSFGSSTPFNAALVTNHSVTINGLQPMLPYYFRVLSRAGANTNSADGEFTTTTLDIPLLTFSNDWRFTTNTVESTWTLPNYDDFLWEGEGAALFYVENNPDVLPKSTPLPLSSSNAVFQVYYFRTHFSVSNSTLGLSLVFTNFIDDGAVFYLNGTEVKRVRMPAGSLNYATFATDCPPNGCDATFETPDVFRVSGDLMTNVLAGDNVLATEVHQVGPVDSDVVFGSAVALVRARAAETKLSITRSNNVLCISWPGEFLTLQQASVLSGANPWSDVPGQIRNSPYCTTNPPGTRFYRLRD